MSGPTITALDNASRAASRAPVSGFVPRRTPAASNPFASLQQEKTVETQVAGHLLDMAKRGMLGGDTSVYHVPHELLEMARRKKKVTAESPPGPAGDNPTAQTIETRAPVGIRPWVARVQPAASAMSWLLPPALSQPRRILRQLRSLDSRTLALAALRRAVAVGPWLVLLYAAYRLITG